MTNNSDENNTLTTATETQNNATWQLNALTEALGDLTLSVENALSVGRGNDNDVVLGSKEISRNHAKLSVLDGKLYIEDLGSSNGTFVNDERLEDNKSKPLEADDTVGFASFTFKVAQPVLATSDSASVKQPVATPVEEDSIEEVVGSVVTEPEVATSKDEPTTDTPAEPVVKETITEDILSSDTDKPAAASIVEEPSEARSTQTVVDEPTVKEPVAEEPVVKEPVVEKPVAEEPVTQRQSEPVAPSTGGQDKTTETELQREADPEVLRAKQAATAQFSGTANLGQSRDVGTEGNNAMDQAVNNTASQGQIEKKPSGSWFIWVFVVILIIGIALWLFNMGGA